MQLRERVHTFVVQRNILLKLTHFYPNVQCEMLVIQKQNLLNFEPSQVTFSIELGGGRKEGSQEPRHIILISFLQEGENTVRELGSHSHFIPTRMQLW